MKLKKETLDDCTTLMLFCCLLCGMLGRVTDQTYWFTIQSILSALFYLGNLLILIVAWRENHCLKQTICQNKWVTFIVLLPIIPMIYLLFR